MTASGNAGGNPLVVALDLPDLAGAADLAARLAGEVGGFKIGLELFAGHGPAAVERVAAAGAVFLDLKLHDIATTVRRAARRLRDLPVWAVTVHATGGPAMVAAARAGLDGGSRRPLVVAVTVLTSLSDADLARLGMPPAAEQVPRLARLAVDAGADGLVCAPDDLPAVRATVGDGPVVVVPAVRPPGTAADEHARSATPAQALAAGADRLVVGRPVTRAADPVRAARAVLDGARA